MWAAKIGGALACLITIGYAIFIIAVIYIGIKCYKDWQKRKDNEDR